MNFSFIHTADIHFGMELGNKIDPNTGLNLRILDYFKSFSFMINYAIKNKVDAFIVAGDLFKNSYPDYMILKILFFYFKKLIDHKIHIVIITGNHDRPKNTKKPYIFSFLENFSFKYFHIISKFNKVLYLNKKAILICFPFVPSSFLKKERSIYNLIETSIEKYPKKNEISEPIILIAHYFIKGSKINESQKWFSSEYSIPISLFNKKEYFDYVAMGDVHKFQILGDKSLPIVYPGSIECINFNEENEDKGFVYAMYNGHKRKEFKFVRTPFRKYKTIYSISNLRKENVADKVIRVKIENENDRQEALDLIKDSFYSILQIDKKDENKDLKKINLSLNYRNDIEKYIKNLEIEKDEKEMLLKYSLKIYDSHV